MKKIKILIVILILIILLSATAFSIYKFAVLNPFASCIGMLEILFTDKEYVFVQKWPHKVLLTKGNSNYCDRYMEERGFKLNDQLGSMFSYKNEENSEVYSIYHLNSYFRCYVWSKQ